MGGAKSRFGENSLFRVGFDSAHFARRRGGANCDWPFSRRLRNSPPTLKPCPAREATRCPPIFPLLSLSPIPLISSLFSLSSFSPSLALCPKKKLPFSQKGKISFWENSILENPKQRKLKKLWRFRTILAKNKNYCFEDFCALNYYQR